MADPPMTASDSLSITVVLSTGARHLFKLTRSHSISDLITALEADPAVEHPPSSTPVVIYRGRLLDPSAILASLDPTPEFAVLVFFRLEGVPITSPDNLEGFDRLLRMDYSELEIANIRAEFHRLHGTDAAPLAAQVDAEDEWFPALFGTGRIGRIHGDGSELPPWRLFFLFALAFLSALLFGPISLVVLFLSCPSRASAAGLVLGLIGYYFCFTYGEMLSSIRSP
jgi:hypothetical protein